MNRVASSRARNVRVCKVRASARVVYISEHVHTRIHVPAADVRDGAHVDTIQDEAPGAVRLMKLMRAAALK